MDKNELLLNTATLRIAESILLTENIEEALSTTLNIVVDILKSEAGAIWLLDKDTNMLHAITSCGPVDLTNVSMDNGIGVEGTSVKEDKSVFISDVEGVENADGCVFDRIVVFSVVQLKRQAF